MQPDRYLDGDARSFPDGEHAPKRHRGIRGLVVLAVLAVVAGAAGVVTFVKLRDRSPSGENVTLPPVQGDVGVTSAYLRTAEGQMIRSIAALGAEVLRAGDAAQCNTAVERLDAIGAVPDVLAAIDAIPDRATADMALNHLDDLALVLGRCLNDRRLPDRTDLEFTQAVLDRRLRELS